MKYISIILMSLFLVGNANADKKGKYGYVRIGVKYASVDHIYFAYYYKTLKECRDSLISNAEYDSENGYRVEFKKDSDYISTITYWKNEKQPSSLTYCAEIKKD